jgi:hypothetical protein
MPNKKIIPAKPALFEKRMEWSKYAFTPEGKFIISIFASAVNDLVYGKNKELKKAAVKWLFYEDAPTKQVAMLLIGLHDDILEKTIREAVGDEAFDALIKLGREPLAPKGKRGRKKIEGVERTKSGRIKRKRGVNNVGRPKVRRISSDLLDNKK